MKQIKDQRGEQRASTRKEKEEQAFSLLVPAATKLGLQNPSWVLIICFSGALFILLSGGSFACPTPLFSPFKTYEE